MWNEICGIEKASSIARWPFGFGEAVWGGQFL